MKRQGINGHTLQGDGASDTWLTPRWVIEKLGVFNLDLCAAPSPRPWATAEAHVNYALDKVKPKSL